MDDDEDVARQVAGGLADFGFEVHVSPDAQSLAALVQEHAPAALIMDMVFPQAVLASTDPIARARQARHSTLPVVFISARNDLDMRVAAERAGGHAFFTKPIDVPALAAKLHSLIGKPSEVLTRERQALRTEIEAQRKRMFGEVCLEKGWISEEQLEQALQEQADEGRARSLGPVLVALGLITEAQRQQAAAEVYRRQSGSLARSAEQVCLENGWITEEQLRDAARQHPRSTGRDRPSLIDVLVMQGVINERQRAEAEGTAAGVRFIDLSSTELDLDVMRRMLQIVPPEICRRSHFVPFRQVAGRTHVAMRNPGNIFVQDQVKSLLGRSVPVEFFAATEAEILRALNRAMGLLSGTASMAEMAPVTSQDDLVFTEKDADRVPDLDVVIAESQEAPIISLCNRIILRAIEERASDIHLQPREEGLRIRFRIDGVLRDIDFIPLSRMPAVISRMKLSAELDIANRLIPQDGRIAVRVSGSAYDLRVSTLPGVWGEEVVMRVLDKASTQVGLEKLGLAPAMQQHIERLIGATYGLILVTGPTGSGKSTTLYSILSRLNAPERKIVTIEDPVEYQLPGLTQVQARPASGLTFAAALKSFLRQDPDVMMVGEIRDLEVGRIAMEAALTGHLVLSTLHTNDAPAAVTRLNEMGIEPFLVSSTLLGVLAQRLVRRICENCKEEYQPDAEAVRRTGFPMTHGAPPVFFRGKGCGVCRQSGYRGRLGIYELLIITDELKQMVVKSAGEHEIRAAARHGGMVSLQEDVMLKIRMGLTTLEEAVRVIGV